MQGGSSLNWLTSSANARRGKTATAISPVALEAVKRIDALFDIERDINGLSAEERLRVRQVQSTPFGCRCRGLANGLADTGTTPVACNPWHLAARTAR
jgi:hypothetical protein